MSRDDPALKWDEGMRFIAKRQWRERLLFELTGSRICHGSQCSQWMPNFSYIILLLIELKTNIYKMRVSKSVDQQINTALLELFSKNPNNAVSIQLFVHNGGRDSKSAISQSLGGSNEPHIFPREPHIPKEHYQLLKGHLILSKVLSLLSNA